MEDGRCVVPGDVVGLVGTQELRIGPGLMQHKDTIIATKAGILRYKEKQKYYWVENNQKRYVPALEDLVIGLVQERLKDCYRVDIGSSQPAMLSLLAFEGATRKNRPNLQMNSLVYARVTLAHKDMEPEIECLSVRKKAEGFGELVGGYTTKCPLHVCRALLDNDCAVLQVLGQRLPYEIAVGMNGRIWVSSGNPAHTVLIANAAVSFYSVPRPLVENMIQQLFDHVENK